MTPILIFLVALAAIALVGWIVHKASGSQAYFLDTWVFDPGETVLWRDDRADVVLVPRLGGAVTMRPVRLHRWAVVATGRRVLLGNRTFGGRQMVRYVLLTGAADAETQRRDGGLLTRGYSTLALAPGVTPHLDARPPYIALTPLAGVPSSVNVAEVRLYTDQGAGFRLG